MVRKALSRLAGLSMVCTPLLLGACVMRDEYGGASTAEADLAIVEGYWHYRFLYDEELLIVSVDGVQKRADAWFFARSITLPAGEHRVELAVLRNSGEEARCVFNWPFQARHRYKITKLSHEGIMLAHPVTPTYDAVLHVKVRPPTGKSADLTIPAKCGEEFHDFRGE